MLSIVSGKEIKKYRSGSGSCRFKYNCHVACVIGLQFSKNFSGKIIHGI